MTDETEPASTGPEGPDREATDETRFERRPFVKLAGAAAAGGALAGCTGGGQGGGTPEGEETVALGGGTTASGDEGTATPTASPLEGITFKFTETMALHSPRAKRTMKKLIDRFNAESPAKANLTIGPGSYDQKWKVLYKNDKYPPAWTPISQYMGSIFTLSFEKDIIYSFSEMQGMIDEDVLAATEWASDGEQSPVKTGYSGWRARGDVDVGLGAVLSNLYYSSYWLANRNHFEEVGLDPTEDFPPKDYEDMLRIGRELENAPSTTGLQLPGSKDLGDCGLPPWTVNLGGRDGLYHVKDWTTTNLTNDVWKEAAKLYTETYTKHGLGSPESPTISDESETVLVAKGDISMANVEPLTIPLVKDQNPEMIENQVAMWGPNYLPHGEGDEWEPGVTSPYYFMPNHTPPKADAAKWEKKVRASMGLYNDYLMNEDFQQFNMPNDLGLVPMRDDTFDPILERMEQEYPDHMIASVVKQVKETQFAWANHPTGGGGDFVTSQMELALKEDQSPAEALEKAKAEYQKVIDDTVFGQA